jgi:hypothetical protein
MGHKCADVTHTVHSLSLCDATVCSLCTLCAVWTVWGGARARCCVARYLRRGGGLASGRAVSSSKALACCRSGVSNPSVNQP